MKLVIYDKLSSQLERIIEKFLLNNFSFFNPLFSSPLWAKRLKELINFNYEFLIIERNKEIIALHLIFYGYKGFARFRKYPFLLKKMAIKFSKLNFSYITWNNFIIFKNRLENEVIQKSKELIYDYIQKKNKKILNSPIYTEDEFFFYNRKIKKWGTYILNFKNKSYKEVYSKFRRQARKSIEKGKIQGIKVKTLDINDKKEIDNFIDFLKTSQKITGKKYKVDKRELINEHLRFNKNNYIYEIFLAYYNNEIHGSLGIWGYNDFINEHGVNYSEFAKKNRLYVQDVIKDEIVKYSIEKGINYYDLSGFNPSEDATQKEKNIKQFKEKFNGEEIIYSLIKG